MATLRDEEPKAEVFFVVVVVVVILVFGFLVVLFCFIFESLSAVVATFPTLISEPSQL